MAVWRPLYPWIVLSILGFGVANAEVHTLTLSEALHLAGNQSPDLLLAKLDEQRTRQNVGVARDPFSPKVTLGSDLTYISGYPNSVNGHSPSLLRANVDMDLFNRSQTYAVRSAKEQIDAQHATTEMKSEDVANQIAAIFLDLRAYRQRLKTLTEHRKLLESEVGRTATRVEEGAELSLAKRRSQVNLLQVEHDLHLSESELDFSQAQLAILLGFPATDRVEPAPGDLNLPAIPPSKTEAIEQAISNSNLLKQLRAGTLAKQLELRSYKLSHLPRVALVAQYSLFNVDAYQDYFASSRIRPNNGQLGASFVVPILVGAEAAAKGDQALIDLQKLNIQTNQARSKITVDIGHEYDSLQNAKEGVELARQQLDLAGNDLSIARERYQENLGGYAEVLNAQDVFDARELAVLDRGLDYEKAQIAILKELGDLRVSLQSQLPESGGTSHTRQ